jgi:hypothetical protein
VAKGGRTNAIGKAGRRANDHINQSTPKIVTNAKPVRHADTAELAGEKAIFKSLPANQPSQFFRLEQSRPNRTATAKSPATV